MRPLADADFHPHRPLQTKTGARQALRCGHNKVEQLIRSGKLRVVKIGRSARVTTESILKVAAGDP